MIIQCVARKWAMLWITCCASLTFQQPTWGTGPAEELPTNKPHRVVMHLNSGDEKVQRGALNNIIKDLYPELGPQNLTVKLVAHGQVSRFVTKKGTAFADELTELRRTYGVTYTACSTTMKAMKVTKEDLISEVDDTVPAMVRLMERQEQGWVSIKR